ncbi:hypothetical protein ACLK17_25600 [Escherichia coli]
MDRTTAFLQTRHFGKVMAVWAGVKSSATTRSATSSQRSLSSIKPPTPTAPLRSSAEALSARQLVDRVRGVQPAVVEGFISCHREWSCRDKEWVETLPYEPDADDTFWRRMATRLNFTSTVARKYFKR